MKNVFMLVAVLFSVAMVAQTKIQGTVNDESGQPIPGANVVLNATTGTTTDFDGNFALTVDQPLPVTLRISSVGFSSTSVEVSSANASLAVTMSESQTLLDEIVVAASRTPERIFESPVTIEKLDFQDIQNTAAVDFYTSLQGLKGVQINNGGLLLQQVNTRGFSTVYNEGFVQLVDGMDNAAPGLNFSMGNLLGINELDIQSVELMPGAASALYGANAIKGILFMNSRNPFDNQGISAYYKSGITSQEAAGQNSFFDVGIRAATQLSDKVAVKAVFSYIEGTDWHAVDYRDINDLSKSPNATDYDAINKYGEVTQNVNLTNAFVGAVLPGFVQAGLLPAAQLPVLQATFQNYAPNYFGSSRIASTGYNETDLTDNKAQSLKGDFAIHYRPWEGAELILNSKVGKGNTMLHATNRNVLKNFGLYQNKAELNVGNLNLKAYLTIEDSGDTHDISALGTRMANAQPGGIAGWFQNYVGSYFGALASAINPNPQIALGTILNHIGSGGQSISDLIPSDAPIHAFARSYANANMLQPGTGAFTQAYANIIGKPIAGGGAAIQDKSRMSAYEANYNMKDVVPFADIIIGASLRNYSLRSNGTLFTDYNGPIEFFERGIYTQVQKGLLDNRLKLTGSIRYDKSEFFDGNFTPRLGVLYNITPNDNIRVSYQTGFRNPSSQDQYIGLDVGTAVLMGSSPDSVDRFRMDLVGQSSLTPFTVTGDMVMNNSYTLAIAAGVVQKADVKNVEPEYVKSYEVGYRKNGKGFAVDINGYYSTFSNFISAQNVITPLYGSVSDMSGAYAVSQGDYRVFSVDGNIDQDVKTMGVNVGIDKVVGGKFDLGLVYEYNKMDVDLPAGSSFEPSFNTPENRIKVSFGSTKLSDQFSFNVNFRWQEAFQYQQSGFIDATIPEQTVLDASVGFKLPILNNANLKVGGANLGGKEILNIPGSGYIGSQYYAQLKLNL